MEMRRCWQRRGVVQRHRLAFCQVSHLVKETELETEVRKDKEKGTGKKAADWRRSTSGALYCFLQPHQNGHLKKIHIIFTLISRELDLANKHPRPQTA